MKKSIKDLFGQKYSQLKPADRLRGWYFVISFAITVSLVDAPFWGVLAIAINLLLAVWQVRKIKFGDSDNRA